MSIMDSNSGKSTASSIGGDILNSRDVGADQGSMAEISPIKPIGTKDWSCYSVTY